MTDDKREKILNSAIELLEECEDVEQVTSRGITDRAGVNLALINYYFGSKDELLKIAVDRIVSKSSEDMYGFKNNASSKDAMRGFITSIAKDMFRFEKYSRIYIPDLLLKDKIALPDKLVGYIRYHFGDSRTYDECKLIAFEITSLCQLLFYRHDDVLSYSGIDLKDDSVLEAEVGKIIDAFLPDVV